MKKPVLLSGLLLALPAQEVRTSNQTERCMSSVQSIFNEENLRTNPMHAMHTYAKDYCLNEEIAVPNGVKPALCVYSGFFLLRFLLPKMQNPARMREMTT